MKKFLSTLSSTLQRGVRGGLLFFALLATTTLWAYDFEVNGICYNYLDGNNVEVTHRGKYYDGSNKVYSGAVTIPASITRYDTTYSVTSIGNHAFRGSFPLTSITIPNSITSIGDYAFSECDALTSIAIPNSVTSIGDYAFSECYSLTSITIPNSVTSIGYKAFNGTAIYKDMSNWKNDVLYIDNCLIDAKTSISGAYTIKENTRLIAEYAFSSCSSLTSVTIPNSVTSIGYYAFSSCSSLTSVTIPNSVTSIGENAFYHCSLTSVTIPNSVTSIGENAFGRCSSLTSVTIPNSVTSIGENAFGRCSSLTSMIVENGNTIYDSRENCNAIIETATNTLIAGCQNTIIPNSVKSIGDYAFAECSSLTSITIPEAVTSIGRYAFYNCFYLTSITIPESVTSIGDYAFYWCSSLTSITIPNSVISIGNYAFSNCRFLTSVTIPNSVTSIGESAFYGCTFTKDNFVNNSILDAEANNYWGAELVDTEIDGLLIRNDTVIDCREFVTSVSIPNSVTSIGSSAFRGCSSLTSITIPNSVKSIGDKAFDDCFSLTSVTIGNSVTSIGSSAFSSCSKLTSVTIPNSVKSIGDKAFWCCRSLTSVTIGNSVTTIGENAFYDCSSLASVTINSDAIMNQHDYLHDIFGSQVKEYIIGDSITEIRNNTFRNFSSLESVTIGESVTSIGNDAFRDCSSLTSITIPNSVTSIGDDAFAGTPWYNNLSDGVIYLGKVLYKYKGTMPANTSINIKDGIVIISPNAFNGCSSLTSVTIPNSVTSIGEYAFNGCSSLTSITIPNSVTSIGEYAFRSCSSLTHITLGNSITSINSDAFKGCSSLTSIVWNVKQWTNPNNYSPFSDIKTNITSFTFGNDVEQIPAYICFGMEKLNAVNIPNATTSIGENAFAGCNKLYDVYCYAMEPPTAYESSFANYNAFLHVPCDNQRVYLLDILFGNFKYVECIEAETTPTDTVVVTPSFNDAEFIWPSNSSADSYTLAISKDGEVFCTLTFNANGQLTGIAFAPSRNGQHHTPAAAQLANGFAFTVTGLDEGANYTYDLLIQDRSGNTLQSYSGEFRTQSTNDRTVTVEYDAAQGQVTGAGTYLVGDTVTLTAIPNNGYRFVRWSNEVEDNPYTFVISDNVTLSAEFEAVIHSSLENTNSQSPMSNYQKIIHNGQLLILRDGKTYNVMGAEIQ